jgi:hypothetical protein
MESTIKEASDTSGGWKIPFVILVVFVGAAAVGLHLYIKKRERLHLL